MYAVHFRVSPRLQRISQVTYLDEDGNQVDVHPQIQLDSSDWDKWRGPNDLREDAAHASFRVNTLREASVLRREILSEQTAPEPVVITKDSDWSKVVDPLDNISPHYIETDIHRTARIVWKFRKKVKSSEELDQVEWHNLSSDQ